MRNEAPAILEKIIEKYEILFSHEHLAKLNRKQGDKARAERRELEIARLKQEIREDFSLLRRRAKDDGFRALRRKVEYAEALNGRGGKWA